MKGLWKIDNRWDSFVTSFYVCPVCKDIASITGTINHPGLRKMTVLRLPQTFYNVQQCTICKHVVTGGYYMSSGVPRFWATSIEELE